MRHHLSLRKNKRGSRTRDSMKKQDAKTKKSKPSVLKKLDAAIKDAIKAKRLDERRQGAVIEAARKVAAMMDEPEWPIVKGKLDNVSPGVFLKYCEKLNLLPDEITPEKKEKHESDKVTEFKKASKYAKKTS